MNSETAPYRRSWRQTFKREFEEFRPRLDLRLALFEEGFSLIFFGLHIPLFFLQRWAYEPEEMMDAWGVSYFERSIYLNWGSWTKFIHMPWDFTWIRTDVLKPDGSWMKENHCYDNSDGRWHETYPYTYALESGEVQNRLATIYVDRMEWRWRMLKWCPWFAKKRTSINVRFSALAGTAEVGERTGSWKGGTIGCGYELRKGETPHECLLRMQRERKFK